MRLSGDDLHRAGRVRDVAREPGEKDRDDIRDIRRIRDSRDNSADSPIYNQNREKVQNKRMAAERRKQVSGRTLVAAGSCRNRRGWESDLARSSYAPFGTPAPGHIG